MTFTLQESRLEDPRIQGLLGEWGNRPGGSAVRAADFAGPNGAFLVAVRSRVAVGCGGLRRLDARTGEIKRLFVAPDARGQRLGHALLEALEQRAAALGLERVRLDTDGREPAALALFRSAGYRSIPDYNGNERARWWFEKRLRGRQ